ncbi:CDGP domain-containing protein [Mycolicibacterium septicum]|uniref:CDGP domain-containing protein n=1 Tax=Mycolicibacterium septicum TaxID=98668 RepID=UPI00235E9762|nr:hypothetical protein [Mycolicibacterium septicum]
MKLFIIGGLATVLTVGGLITSAPPASAGCVYGGNVISKCDGPIQPDGSWQRCIGTWGYVPSGWSSHLVPVKRCDPMGPGHDYPLDFTFTDPPTHIDD